MIVLIVAIGTISEIYRARLRANAEKSEGFFQELTRRIARLEERMANIETIVLEKERAKKFSDLEDDEN
jgi:hypothetical protein